MHPKLLNEIRYLIGDIDSPNFLKILKKFGVEEGSLEGYFLKIPKNNVSEVKKLQSELSYLSSTGRTFELTEEEGFIKINLIKINMRPQYSSNQVLDSFSFFNATPWGKSQNHVELPSIPAGSKVLDVGAGNGFLAEKIRNELKCEVYALEPALENKTDYQECVNRLGEEFVEKLTLQEAIELHPEKYAHAFDVITVFKYNIPFKEKEAFFQSLVKALKPNGILYITSVEQERFNLDPKHKALYLMDTIREHFNIAFTITRYSTAGVDGLLTASEPKLVKTPQMNSR